MTSSIPSSIPSSDRLRVLVVDDDPGALRSVEAVLSSDFHVVTCASAERALRQLSMTSYHVVCSDYRMPGIDGIEFFRRIAALPVYVGRVLITGAHEYFENGRREKYYVLIKPFDPERLLDLVGQLARIAQMKRAVGSIKPTDGRKPTP